MKRWTLFVTGAAIVAAVTAGMLITGCEEDPDVSDLSDVDDYFNANPYPPGEEPALGSSLAMTPDQASVAFAGESIPFFVRGGTPTYHWTVANNAYGHMEVISGNTDAANYVADVLGPNVVTVRDSAGRASQAPITVAGSETFSITPAAQSFSTTASAPPYSYWFDGEQIQFAVSGGTPPYSTWHVTVASMGTINPATGLYTVKGGVGDPLGTNTVWIADNLGAIAQAVVVTAAAQVSPPDFAIIPDAVTFTTTTNDTPPYWFHNEKVNFGVVGGAGTITWHVTKPGLGTLSQLTGRTNLYTVIAAGESQLGENTVWAEDSLGNYAEATVTTSVTTPSP